MTILTPAQVQEMADCWPLLEGATHYTDCWEEHLRCALARLIASHRAVVEERDGEVEAIKADAWDKMAEKNKHIAVLERTLANHKAEARRMQAVGVRRVKEKAAKNVYMSKEADLPGDFGGPASCEYGCGKSIADWCEAEAARLEASASTHTGDAPAAGYPPSRIPASE